MNLSSYSKVVEFIMENTEIVTFPLLPEIRLRVLTEKSKYFYANEAEFLTYGIYEPFFLFCWPGGQALARYILDNKSLIEGKNVLVFGGGCGVEGIAAALCKAKYVMVSDVDPNALIMSKINIELNNVKVDLSNHDFFLSDCYGFDVILAGDMFYDVNIIDKFLLWLKKLKSNNKQVLCADPFRGNLSPEKIHILGIYYTIRDGEFYSNNEVKTTVFTIRLDI